MNAFGDLYAQYYDLLYKEKDYEGEVRYIIDLIKKFHPSGSSIFELGCGTGIHAGLFARAGYSLFGIDLSAEMLKAARMQEKIYNNLSFDQGNIETYKAGKKFDIALSLFHVISYLNTNESLTNTFRNVYDHLTDEGIFAFDCWFGPAVLTDLPVVRVKRLENENLEVTRIAEPELFGNRNVCDVNYSLFIRDKKTEEITTKKERHSMRYFFIPEMEFFLATAGFKITASYRYMSFNAPDLRSWNVIFMCKKGTSA